MLERRISFPGNILHHCLDLVAIHSGRLGEAPARGKRRFFEAEPATGQAASGMSRGKLALQTEASLSLVEQQN